MLEHQLWVREVSLTSYQRTCSSLDVTDVDSVLAIKSNPGEEAITRRFAFEGGTNSKVVS